MEWGSAKGGRELEEEMPGGLGATRKQMRGWMGNSVLRLNVRTQ